MTYRLAYAPELGECGIHAAPVALRLSVETRSESRAKKVRRNASNYEQSRYTDKFLYDSQKDSGHRPFEPIRIRLSVMQDDDKLVYKRISAIRF